MIIKATLNSVFVLQTIAGHLWIGCGDAHDLLARPYLCLAFEQAAVKPVVHLLQIQEVHLVPHSSACNFIYFLYLSYLGHTSRLGLQTKTRR